MAIGGQQFKSCGANAAASTGQEDFHPAALSLGAERSNPIRIAAPLLLRSNV
jgi:hypothetical protein